MRTQIQRAAPHQRPSLADDESGATTLEWTLLVAGIAIPAWLIMNFALNLLVAHYWMLTTLNALPVP
jgi:hypothetical protein